MLASRNARRMTPLAPGHMNKQMIYHPFAMAALAAAICGSAWAQTTDLRSGSPWQTDAAHPTAPEEPRILRGNDRIIAPPANAAKLSGPSSTLRFEAAPILEVVRVILGDIAKADYVMHQPINGSVTLATRDPVTPDQAMFLLESALQTNGLVMGRDARGVYHVGPPDTLKSIVPAVRQVSSAPLPPGHGAIILPLQYIGANEMATILRPMVPSDAIVRVDTMRNLLIMAGSRAQAEGWLEMVATFDVNLLQGMSVGVFELKHATIAEVESALRLLTATPPTTAATPAPTGPGAAPRPNPTQAAQAALLAQATAASTDTPTSLGPIRVMPMSRINSILVMSPRAAYLEEARRWIEKLDRPGSSATEPALFVYPVQNSSARHIAEVLNGIFGGGGTGTSSSATSGVAPGLNSSFGTSFGSGMQSGGLGTMGGGNNFGRQTQGLGSTNNTGNNVGVSSSTLISGVRVVADEVNNAVLIYATRREFEKIEASIRRLDLQPTQVLIEASIIEVSLKDGLEYGLQWFFNGKAGDGRTGTGVLSEVGGAVLGGAKAGFSYTLRNSVGDIRAVLNALANKSLIKVISSPSLMVQDNFTASIMVGNQQPIRTGETVTTGGNVSTSIQYKDTGVNLQVTPSVNAGNIVNMLINQAVTDVGAVDDATGQRAFLQRQISSKVSVRSGEALVLGGLIRDNTTSGKSGIPLLQDIPLVGPLFGSNNRSIDRTELLVVITPRVVRNDIDAREISAELRTRMKSLGSIEALELQPQAVPPHIDAIPLSPLR
jgi:general secretion pathway protein D